MSGRSWGIELWDQSENLLKHLTEQNVNIDSYLRLFTDIHRLQFDHGKRLRKIVTGFQRNKTSFPDESTFTSSFDQIFKSLSTLCSICDSTSKDLEENVVKIFKQSCDTERKELESRRNDVVRLNQNLGQSRKQLETTWQKYVVAFKDQQKALENWERSKKEVPPSRVDQLKDLYIQKQYTFEQCKANYAAELNKYNSSLRQHYNKGLVNFLEELSLHSRSRTEQTKVLLVEMADIYVKMCTKFSEFLQSMKDTVSTIDSFKDDELIIKTFKTGELVPVDLPFLDLEHCQSSVLEGTAHTLGSFLLGINPSDPCTQLSGLSSHVGSTGVLSNFIRGGSKGSREESFNLRSPFVCDISINSLKETDFTIIQLSERLSDLSNQLKVTESELDGTRRLLEAYRQNSYLGKPETVEPKVDMLQRRINSLKETLNRLKDRFVQLGGETRLIVARKQLLDIQSSKAEPRVQQSSVPKITADSDDSFDSGDSDTEARPSGATNILSKPANYVGYATMKYMYEGNGSLCLAAKPGDFFYVVKLDTDGSGWTSVVSQDGSRTGLVPTEYIELTKY